MNLENDDCIAVFSGLGATLDRFYDKRSGLEHAWNYDSSVWPRRTHICFPVCGRLIDGEYIHQEKTYPMPMHGFLREKACAIKQISKSEGFLHYRSDESTLGIYPFDFSVRIHARLDEEGLSIGYEVENTGSIPMPYSIGSHYNYSVPIDPRETLADYCIDFFGPQNAGRLLVADGLIAGMSEDIFQGNSVLRLDGLFANGAVALELSKLSTRKVALRSLASHRYTAVSMENFDYLLLWAPGNEAPFICIEAWAGIFDSLGHDKILTHKKGIRSLSPGSTHRYEQKIAIGKD